MRPGERLVPIREIRQQGDSSFFGKATVHDTSGGGPLLKVEHVSKSFSIRKAGLLGGDTSGTVLAVDDVSFTVKRGECLGLVGESGCGKTTLSKMLLRALRPDSGSITFTDYTSAGDQEGPGEEIDVLAQGGDALMAFRKKIQFVFHDPFSSLNPRLPVGEIMAAQLTIHRLGTPAAPKPNRQ